MNKLNTRTILAFTLMTLTIFGIVSKAAVLPISATQLTVTQPIITQPTTIQDAILLESWNLLNNRTEPVQLWDGHTISGHELAQFVLARAIPIVWNTENACGGSSCSKRYCQGDFCSHETDTKPGVEPIYINLIDQSKGEGNLDGLVDTLAHEIYHYTQPYGPVDDTLYEEYSAYYVGASISKKSWTNFEDYNPLQPACLEKWFYDTHLLDGYQARGIKAYPTDVVPSVDISSTTCQPKRNPVNPAALNNSPICTLGLDGSASCQFPPAPTPTPEYRLECKKYPSGLVGCETIWLKGTSTPQETPTVP